MPTRPPLPPFTLETAIEKVRLAEDGWNSRDAEKVSLAYSEDTRWRNRTDFVSNRSRRRTFCRQNGRKSTITG